MIRRISEKRLEQKKLDSLDTKKLHEWFLGIWDKREETDGDGRRYVTCYESGMKLFRGLYRMNTCCYSHLLSKEKYPDLAMVEENVVIVHPEEHNKYGKNMDKTPRQRDLKEKLIEKYGRSFKRKA